MHNIFNLLMFTGDSKMKEGLSILCAITLLVIIGMINYDLGKLEEKVEAQQRIIIDLQHKNIINR